MKNYTLITGATGGIGIELATVFAKNNHNLILTGTSSTKLEQLKKHLNSQYDVDIYTIDKDLTHPSSAKDIYDEVTNQQMNVDILCNNAGFGDYGLFHTLDLSKQSNMVEVNVQSLMKLTYLFLQDMIQKKHGKIMNTCSTAAFQPGPFMATYYASKAFVLSFSEALYKEVKDQGIHVMALCPGPTKSHFFERAGSDQRNNKLLKNFKVADPKKLSEFAYKCLFKKRVIAIYGVKSKLLIFLERLLPRWMVRNSLYKLQERKYE